MKTQIFYVEPMFLSNKTEMIYKMFYIVKNSNKHRSQFFAYF